MSFDRRRKKRTVLFLCTGDTCRGPMAQGYMKHAMAERGITNVEVKTAGVMTIAGLIPQAEAVQVMDGVNIDVRGHRSSPLSKELIRKCDLILGMTPFHVQFAMRESEDARGITFLLKEFAESDVKNYQITDPMGHTLEVYKRVFREMKLAIDKMLDMKEFFTGKPEVAVKHDDEDDEPAKKSKPAKKKSAATTEAPAKSKGKTAAPAKKKKTASK